MRLKPSPILIKEMRSTMRGARTFVGITLFLLLLAGGSLMVYYTLIAGVGGASAAYAGRTIFGFVSVAEALMLAAVAPPLTAGAIASERQKQTLDLLMATPLSPAQVLRGKLLASMNYLFLLMLAGLPINALVFLFGGVPPTMLLWWVALVATVLLLLGTLGLLMSTLFRSSGVATALCYLICVLLFGALPLGAIVLLVIMGNDGREVGCVAAALGLLHPAASMAAILVEEPEFNARLLLPASLPLYGALAGLLFLAAEARLAALTSYPWRSARLTAALVGVAGLAALYIGLGPALTICRQW